MSREGYINRLARDHADLDRQIQEAQQHPGVDRLEISDLKKRKLRIKEELEAARASA